MKIRKPEQIFTFSEKVSAANYRLMGAKILLAGDKVSASFALLLIVMNSKTEQQIRLP